MNETTTGAPPGTRPEHGVELLPHAHSRAETGAGHTDLGDDAYTALGPTRTNVVLFNEQNRVPKGPPIKHTGQNHAAFTQH
jgi:hypothetical protein